MASARRWSRRAELDGWSSRPWPAWNEPTGNLTVRGAELAKLLGRYYRDYLIAEQMPPRAGVPASRQPLRLCRSRTAHEGDGAGAARRHRGGCGIAYRTKPDAKIDGALPSGRGRRVQARCAGRADRHPAARGRRHEQRLARLQDAARGAARRHGLLQAALCAASGTAGRLQAGRPADRAFAAPRWHGRALFGALAIASDASEIFLWNTRTAWTPTRSRGAA